jgi:hypothetical protein
MPFTYETDRAQRLVRVVIRGTIHLQDLLEQIDAVGVGGLFTFRHLVDARESIFDLSTEDVRTINSKVTELKESFGSGRTALIAGDDVTFGMGRMNQIISKQTIETFNVFRDVSEAEAWLDEGIPTSP